VPYKGSLAMNVFQMVGGLRSGMGYTGCRTVKELREKARFIQITAAGLRESHVHDVIITGEAPNYHAE
jgi:IMP dehydrogenase